MYALDLICSNGHKFESWFRNRETFESQREEGMISCPFCSDSCIEQVISAPRIGRHSEKQTVEANPVKNDQKLQNAQMKKFLEMVEKNFDDVGARFPEEALKIHLGETEQRNIKGTATPEEEKELKEEGVPFFKIPEIQ